MGSAYDKGIITLRPLFSLHVHLPEKIIATTLKGSPPHISEVRSRYLSSFHTFHQFSHITQQHGLSFHPRKESFKSSIDAPRSRCQ